jgi:hypothetical protein
MTQTQAAKELGISWRGWQDLERGVCEPSGYGRVCMLKMLDTHEKQKQKDPQ